MTKPTIEQVTAVYLRLRELEAEIGERHSKELEPLAKKKGEIENWLLNEMNTQSVDSFKTPAGTPYKKIQTAVKLDDPEIFRNYILQPVADAVQSLIAGMGYVVAPHINSQIATIVAQNIRWDLADLRVGKKGVQEFIEETQAPPPGVSINTFATVNVRRS